MIETTSGLIGFVDSLETLHEVLTDERQQGKVFDLSDEFGGWRRCKGDGNCFYRACGFALIEAALCTPDAAALKRLSARLQEEAGAEAADLVALLYELPPEPVEAMELWYGALLCNADLDAQLVRALRLLCAAWLRGHRNLEFHEVPIGIYAESVHSMDLDELVEREVLGEGKEAELLMIFATTKALNARLEIIQVDRSQGPAQRHQMPDDSSTEFAATLLFRPGHYDIFYRRGLYQKVAQIQEDLQLKRSCHKHALGGGAADSGDRGDGDEFHTLVDSLSSRGSFRSRDVIPTIRSSNNNNNNNNNNNGDGLQEIMDTMRGEMQVSLAKCAAALDQEQVGLALRLQRLEAQKAAVCELREETAALKGEVSRRREDLLEQQKAVSREMAERKEEQGFWALFACPAPKEEEPQLARQKVLG